METIRAHSTGRILLALFFGALATLAWAGSPGKDFTAAKPMAEPNASGERILARLAPGRANTARLNAVLRANEMRLEREFRTIPGLKVLRLVGNAKAEAASRQGLERRIEALKATGLFAYVEPDWQVQALQVPTDSSFSNGDLWGLRNTGQNGGIPGVDVNAVNAWSITAGSPAVVVAVIDSGIRYSHQDLAGNMWTNPGEIPGNLVDDDGNGYIDDVFGINAITGSGNPMDDNDHGTHVAGTIAATAFDAGRHVGVAYNVRLMALKFLDATGGGTVSNAISCIDYAVTHGADILNNSWGGTGYSQALDDAVASAEAAGILFVAAAGNSGTNNDTTPIYPAGFDHANVLSVAAIDRTGSLASFSNFGIRSVDLSAPGVSILSTTSVSDSSYAFFNGTSMATPHVSGVAALVASEQVGISLEEMMARLRQSVIPLPALDGRVATGGMVNAAGALLITEDGDMELSASTFKGALVADQLNTIEIRVTDLLPVTGASVSGALAGGSVVPFLDDGVAPDAAAGDALYTADVFVNGGVEEVQLDMSATATGKNPSVGTAVFPVITPPPNDDFANRIALSNAASTATGTNVEATLELNEPVNPSFAGSHSAWWEWTPSQSGDVTVSTSGSSFDTTLAIYQGASLGSLVLVGANDDAIGLASAVGFVATAGQTYLIQVNGYGNETGEITLNYGEFSVGPPNNDFANRILLQPGTTQTTGSNVGSNFEDNEPHNPLTSDLYSVWWEWNAPSSNPVTIDTIGSNFDTTIAVYTGTTLTDLVLVAANDDIVPFDIVTSSVTFTPVPGRSYMIQVNGYFIDGTGTIVLNYPDPAPPAVPNDNFAQRILLPAGSTQTTGTNEAATTEINEPVNPAQAGTHSVWWEWISPVSGTAVIDTYGSTYDTTLAVYSGTSLENLVLVAANDNATGLQSEVSFIATQGASYKIQVNGSGSATGSIKLTYPVAAAPKPANDNFSDRILLPYSTTEASGSNAGATAETGEPLNPVGAGERSVWWEWIAPSPDPATISTAGSDFDTTLAVYTGSAFGDLILIAADNDTSGQQASVTFTPVAGQHYLVQVNGFGDSTGTIKLSYPGPGLPRPPNDNFADRIILAPGTIRATGSNEAATSEPNESINPLGAGGHTVWWEWIAPHTGEVTIDTVDSLFDTTLAVYTGDSLDTLSLVGANDDFVSYYAGLTFEAVAGESYLLQVDGFEGGTGTIYLNYHMPFPVAVDPGRLRLQGIPGGTAIGGLTLRNGDPSAVNFSISSSVQWIQPVPATGSVPAGSSLPVSLNVGPLPAFSAALEANLSIDLDHPDLTSISVPVEVVHQSIVIQLPDPNLRRVVEQHLNRLPGEPTTSREMQVLTSLYASGRGIVNLQGLQHASNLFYLYLDENRISNVNTLAWLENLFILDLRDNNLFDIASLTALPILWDVDLRLNYLDINPGSDDRAVIDTLSATASVLYDPQKDGLLDLATWASLNGVPQGQDNASDINGPLALENSLSFAMGLNPYTASASDLPVANRDPDTNQWTFTYYRNLNALGVNTTILNSTDLNLWDPAIPLYETILWDDGSGHQQVEAVFESPSDKLFFILEAEAY